MPDAAPLEPGDPRALGQYEVIGRLGAGGQGAVFLGKAPGGQYVAVKLLHAQMANDPAARARFTREVSAAQKVEPFCTARVLEADVHGDQPYVVSEFIDGPSLHDVVAHDGPRGAAELERLAIGTVTALAAIHEAGIVHRDFKPNNVMLASDGPRVVDFGIARTVNSQESAVTATGMVVGTPGYLAPEQLTGAPLTPAVDIFAWAATMVFAATGQSPFEADTLPVIINRILNEDPDLSALPPGPLRDLIGRCLSKDAGLRPPAPQLLLNLLGHVGAAPAGQGAGQEDLLNQGTRIASQLPPPPPVPPAPRPQPQQQPITPPPMPLHQGGMGGNMGGPNTPPPQPITPPPMPMYQGAPMPPSPPSPPPMQMQQPVPPGPGYGPPKQSSSAGPIIAIGCGALALIVILVVVVLVIIGANSDDDPPVTTYTPPTNTYTPSDRPTTSTTGGLLGVWDGNGNQPSASSGHTSFQVRFALLYTSGTARYTYPSGAQDNCYTRLSLISDDGDGGKVEYRETPMAGMDPKECASGYITFIPSSSTSMRWEWRQTQSSPSPDAYGTVSK
ncbi:serine/threonine protein kinase [Actinomadura madurae]|uniref:serine/threonine-protein kinase n=1 Tax=Actinomadura madurae TaxID=1993 RepID=UPI002026DE82|nr:serine/threonine-protein kinase [Actinomadura madurae]URM94833.1 serine/threonine protein kinase [Actinomadura madurae]URN05558.1 serine/threonine protein kinase [Actinomadura madurae]